MTDISITLDDKLYERFNTVCQGLDVDPVAYIEGHARDAMKNKLKELAEEFKEDGED